MKLISTAVLFGVAVAVAGCGSKQQAAETKNVFGSDDRVAITTDGYPWRTIGKVFGMGCSGTLVARDLVLTAAHCVVNSATGQMRTDITYFRPNYKNGASAQESWISHVWWGTNKPDQNRAQDWAILKLAKPLGDQYGWLGIRPTDTNSFPPALSVAGYSGDFMSGKTAGVHHNCTTKKRIAASNFILHDCDMTRGASGGPALRMYDNKLTIVGVNVAEYRNGGETSLHLGQYSDQYANIVIPTKDLILKVKELIGVPKTAELSGTEQ